MSETTPLRRYSNTATIARRLVVLALGLALAACAALTPEFEQPTVALKSFSLAPSQSSMTPEFLIVLRVVNPNGQSFRLRGVAYSASIEGHRVLTGASSDLPELAAYSETDVTLRASADVMGSFRLLSDLMGSRRDGLNYALSIKLDVGSLMPPIQFTEQGKIRLNNPRNPPGQRL